jgi:surface antigen
VLPNASWGKIIEKLPKKWFTRPITRSLVARPNPNTYGKICKTNFASQRTETRIVTGGFRAQSLCLGMLCLAASVANSVALTDTYDYRGVCPTPDGGKKILDKWQFWICECVSYAADKLNERGLPFNDHYKGVTWKSGGNWINAATAAGVPYSRTPRRGDVARIGQNHVAYVEAVDSYGDVTISEYNWVHPHDYSTRTLKPGTTAYPSNFIHF